MNFDLKILKQLYTPAADSHKGQNGKLLLIGGSHLFHAASLWSLTIASRIVDMVFYSSVPENNKIVEQSKAEFRNGIVVRREDLEDYVAEADCILIGPGLVRSENSNSNFEFRISNLSEINGVEDEGLQTRYLTQYLLEKYPHKKWVIDAGALQMMDPEWLLPLNRVIVTPHVKEFDIIQSKVHSVGAVGNTSLEDQVRLFADKFGCIVLLKGEQDIICNADQLVRISGGNAGMTKGGTGDVLAGLVAALACNNDLWLSACAGSFFNKRAGESLAERVGFNFNASDLALEIPQIMHQWQLGFHE